MQTSVNNTKYLQRYWSFILSLGILLCAQPAAAQNNAVEPALKQPHIKRALKTKVRDSDPVATAFIQAYGFNPLRADRMPSIIARQRTVYQLSGFAATVQAGRKAAAAPLDPRARQVFARYLNGLLSQTGSSNLLAVLYFVMKESIQEQNEDKRYWLGRLREQNKIAEALNNQMRELNNASQQLAQRERQNRQNSTVDVRTTRLSIARLPQHQFKSINTPQSLQYKLSAPAPRKLNRSQLQAEIAAVENQQETVRNDRQMASTQFENANQKATQYINMLSSVLKTMNEMRKGVIRNIR